MTQYKNISGIRYSWSQFEPGCPGNMNPQVLPLKVLVSREVVRNKMDYSTFLNGTLKEELDRLDRLAGNFRIEASKLVIEGGKFLYTYRGKIVPSDDVQKLKLPETETETLINFINGMARFRIAATLKVKEGLGLIVM